MLINYGNTACSMTGVLIRYCISELCYFHTGKKAQILDTVSSVTGQPQGNEVKVNGPVYIYFLILNCDITVEIELKVALT